MISDIHSKNTYTWDDIRPSLPFTGSQFIRGAVEKESCNWFQVVGGIRASAARFLKKKTSRLLRAASVQKNVCVHAHRFLHAYMHAYVHAAKPQHVHSPRVPQYRVSPSQFRKHCRRGRNTGGDHAILNPPSVGKT